MICGVKYCVENMGMTTWEEMLILEHQTLLYGNQFANYTLILLDMEFGP
jgi:hypothetical protein